MRRHSTNTPIQALVLMNDVQYVEAARVLGERILRGAPHSDVDRIELAFAHLAGRAPDARELEILLGLYGEQRALFDREPDRARRLIAVGASKPGDHDPVELAAATIVAQTILNLDATIWKR